MKTSIKPLKIALVSDAIYPYNIGGKEKRIYEISRRLARKGHKVTIYTMKWWKQPKTRIVHDKVVHEAISPLYPIYHGERRSMSEAIWFSIHCLSLLTKDFDVIEVDHMPHLVLFPLKFVCLVKGKKLHATWNEVWGKKYWIHYLGKLGYVAAIIEKWSVKMPDVFIAVSHHTASRLKREFHITKPILTVPNGIDVTEMKGIRASHLKSDLIYTGRLLEHKNVDLLIEAIGKLEKDFGDITCRIVGNGPEEPRLKRLVRKLKLEKRVIFHDFFPENHALFSLIKAARAFILPSSREGFGLVAIEAQALGVPVVTYNYAQNASRELIQEGTNGYLFDKQEKPLDMTLRKVLGKKHNRETIVQTTEEYDWDTIAHKVEEIYLR